ncbi:MAG TPA: Fe-S cluster assembly protein SufB, partial [Candidatus Atribacteria bacterium]|nr:Fe-S cluster assembly protein SufB [Candidatus Atribacteria bacterium]
MVDEYLLRQISEEHSEPEWMLRLRRHALALFNELPEPKWLRGLEDLNLDDVVLYSSPQLRADSWEDLPEDVRRVYERIHLPDREKEYLAGLSTTLDSNTVYSTVVEALRKRGVILEPMNEAVKRYPDPIRR